MVLDNALGEQLGAKLLDLGGGQLRYVKGLVMAVVVGDVDFGSRSAWAALGWDDCRLSLLLRFGW
jgi:hypothetical protein